ncbi:hypothetical protein QCN29_31840 [Streptomyces sp. HNM0663]|uniref:Sugar ABC transporter substrate-binding protein n=1 Tax=Streptomyces chengmaiensis TaxID=3040919 RepID=A0ABT6HX54_9ACTN|nr:hypothetical protein [Streptomyces chengmaiensis]MDH2393281.1 hypothetical protein [Streptomyces chengmaiensis]
MKRRFFALSASGVVGALVLSACGGGGSGASGVDGITTIKFVAADYGSNGDSPSQAYWQDVITAFEKKNPKIKVDLQVIN